MKTRLLLLALCCLSLAGPASAEIPAQLNYQGRVAVQGTNFNGTGQFKFALVLPSNLNQTATASGIGTVSVTSVNVGSGGSGYDTPPLVTIAPPDDPAGVQATATATIDGGVVTGITITEAGSGYFNNPVQVTIAPPPTNIQYFTSWSNDQTSMSGGEPTGSVSIPVTNGLYSVKLGDTQAGMAALLPGIFASAVELRVWFSDGVNDFQQLTPDQPLSAAPYAFRAVMAEDVPFNSITSDEIAEGAVASADLASGAVNATKLAPSAVTSSALAAGAVGPASLATNAVTADKLADGIISPAKLSSASAPSAGQLLRFDGTQFAWAAQGLSLPFSGYATTDYAAFYAQNNSTGAAIAGATTSGDGVQGYSSVANKSGVLGTSYASSGGGRGVYGYGWGLSTGVLGESQGGDGVSGRTSGTFKSGVFGYASGADSAGVHGASDLHHGVYAATGSASKSAIWAWAPNGAEAIHGHSDAGHGVVGFAGGIDDPDSELPRKAGVYGSSSSGHGVQGYATATFGAAVFGKTDHPYGYAGFFSNTNYDGSGGSACSIYCRGRLEVHGDVWVYGGVSSGLSDERLKDVSGDYERGLDDILRIRTVRYSFKPGQDVPGAGAPRVGVTAQAVREIMPEAITIGPNDYLMLNTEPVFWAMVNSIQELKAENDDLRARLEALEAKVK